MFVYSRPFSIHASMNAVCIPTGPSYPVSFTPKPLQFTAERLRTGPAGHRGLSGVRNCGEKRADGDYSLDPHQVDGLQNYVLKRPPSETRFRAQVDNKPSRRVTVGHVMVEVVGRPVQDRLPPAFPFRR